MTSTISTGAQPLLKSMKKVRFPSLTSLSESIVEQYPKPKIIQFLNIEDNSI